MGLVYKDRAGNKLYSISSGFLGKNKKGKILSNSQFVSLVRRARKSSERKKRR